MKRVLCLILALLVGALASGASAQIAGGNIYGTVTDQSGGVLPGVDVTLVVHVDRRPAAHDRHRRPGTVPVPQPRCRHLQGDGQSHRLQQDGPRRDRHHRRERDDHVPDGREVGRGDGDRHRRDAGRRHQEGRHARPRSRPRSCRARRSRRIRGRCSRPCPASSSTASTSAATKRPAVRLRRQGRARAPTRCGTSTASSSPTRPRAAPRRCTSTSTRSTRSRSNTGGNDLKVQTGGLGINFVTRRGTNQFKGNAKFTLDNDAMESSNLPDALEGRRAARRRRQGQPHRLDPRLGLRHRRSDPQGQAVVLGLVRQQRHRDHPAQPDHRPDDPEEHQRQDQLVGDAEGSGVVLLLQRREGKARPLAGPGQQRGRFVPVEPGQLLSRETASCTRCTACGSSKTTTCSARTSSSTRSTRGSAGATASRRAAAPTRTAAVDVFNDQAHGSWSTYTARKPWHIVDVSGSAFKSATGGTPRVQVRLRLSQATRTIRRRGGAARKSWATSTRRDDKFAQAYRARVVNFVGENYNAFFGDTFSKGRLTVERRRPLGQADGGERRAARRRRNTAFPDLLPSLTFDGGGPTINWNDISPRVGVTYALDETAQDGGPRLVRALRRPAESVRGDVRQPGRRLLHVTSPITGSTRTATDSRRRTRS